MRLFSAAICGLLYLVCPALGFASDDLTVAECHRRVDQIDAYGKIVRFERRDQDWCLVELGLQMPGPEFEFNQLKGLTSIEELLFHAPFPERLAKSELETLATLRELRRLKINPLDLTERLALVLATLPVLEELDLSHYGSESSESYSTALKTLRHFPHLRKLNLSRLRLRDDQLKFVEPLRDLEELKLDWVSGLTEAGFRHLLGLRKLRLLNLPSGFELTEAARTELATLRDVTTLNLGRLSKEQADVAALEQLSRLESLTCHCLVGVDTVNFSGFEQLKALDFWARDSRPQLPAGLQKLEIAHHSMTYFDWRTLSKVEEIEVYCALEEDRPQASLEILMAVPELKRLRLNWVSDEDLAGVAGLTSLQELHLRRGGGQCGCTYGDKGLMALSRLQNLQAFTSNSYLMTDAGIRVLENFTDLRRLELRLGKEVTFEGLKPIWGLKRLQVLDLDSIPADTLTDQVFDKVSGLSDLEELSIPGRLSDDCLLKLTRLKNLRRLDLDRNHGYTDQGLVALIQALPDLQTVKCGFRK